MATIDRALELKVRILATNRQCIGTRTEVSTITDIAGTRQSSDSETLSICTECIITCKSGIYIERSQWNAISIVEVEYRLVSILASTLCIDSSSKLAPVALELTANPGSVDIDGSLTSQLTGIVASTIRIPDTRLTLRYFDIHIIGVAGIDTITCLQHYLATIQHNRLAIEMFILEVINGTAIDIEFVEIGTTVELQSTVTHLIKISVGSLIRLADTAIHNQVGTISSLYLTTILAQYNRMRRSHGSIYIQLTLVGHGNGIVGCT